MDGLGVSSEGGVHHGTVAGFRLRYSTVDCLQILRTGCLARLKLHLVKSHDIASRLQFCSAMVLGVLDFLLNWSLGSGKNVLNCFSTMGKRRRIEHRELA